MKYAGFVTVLIAIIALGFGLNNSIGVLRAQDSASSTSSDSSATVSNSSDSSGSGGGTRVGVTNTGTGSDSKESSKVADAVKNCAVVQTHVSAVSSEHEANKTRYTQSFKNLFTHISALAKRFNEKGVDTSTLNIDLATLNTKVTKLNTDFTAYTTQLAQAKTSACGKSETEFKTTLSSARAEITVVKADVSDIQTFYQNTIRADLLALKALVAANEHPSSTTTSTTTTTTNVPSTLPTTSTK